MNKKRIFHCDLKDSNVLVQDEYDNFHTRIIDWGLSVYIEEKTLKIYPQIPKILEDRPFQFNVPFSIVLFNSLFDKMYSDFLIDNPTPSTYQLDKFVDKYLNFIDRLVDCHNGWDCISSCLSAAIHSLKNKVFFFII